MSAGSAGVLLFLAVITAALAWVWHLTNPEREPPPGFHITHYKKMGWSYWTEDSRYMQGPATGYLTRGSAVRAARQEIRRVQKGISTP